MLMLDIDHFKKVNDTYGHLVGDLVLRKISRMISKSLSRTTDWCARLGGEEFAVVLEGTNLADARVCAEKVRMAIAGSPINTSAGAVRINVSVGISALEEIADRGSVTVPSLQERADINLYASKAGGRNRVTASESNRQSVRDTHANDPVSHIR